ncbi:MAG TPA: hypothetical protein VNO34_02200 [Actinomycetota bacterium]|nr:hypothetical protein [Actinomycetota bacterium]
MGLHTGCPRLTEEGYVWEDVHQAARIAAAAHCCGCGGRVEYPVPPLAEAQAVELFCARARVGPDPTVAELCRRLDHLPLAIELAAAPSGLLSPTQILERLSARLDLLKGRRDADPRQRTLRATIEWSHDLLTPDEQRLSARLSVSRGGCTLEAAQAVAGADLEGLQSLLDKSLLRREDRFWMLETIREYAAARLQASGEAEDLRRGHAEYFLALGEEAEPHLRVDSIEWVDRMDREHDNLRLSLHERLGDPRGAPYSRFLFGYAAVESGDFAGALPTWRRASGCFATWATTTTPTSWPSTWPGPATSSATGTGPGP